LTLHDGSRTVWAAPLSGSFISISVARLKLPGEAISAKFTGCSAAAKSRPRSVYDVNQGKFWS
jgi:hypothetical protein